MAFKNRLELIIMGYRRDYYYETSHYDEFGAYWVGDLKFLSYKKQLKDDQKYAIIKNHLDSFAYDWNEYAYHNMINIYHFRHIRKNNELIAIRALSVSEKNAYFYWERWAVLKDGTILRPEETEKIIKLLLDQSLEIDSYDSLYIKELW